MLWALRTVATIIIFVLVCYMFFGTEPVFVIDLLRTLSKEKKHRSYIEAVDKCKLFKRQKARIICLEDALYKKYMEAQND